jgi:hypothetical protein
MSDVTYPVQRGATAQWLLWAPPGIDLTGWGCVAAVRALPRGKFVLAADAAVAAEYVVEAFDGDDTRGPGWYLTLASEITAGDAMPAGLYLADARLAAPGGSVVVTKSWTIQLQESASRPSYTPTPPPDPAPGDPPAEGGPVPAILFTLEGPGVPGTQAVAIVGPKGDIGPMGDVTAEVTALVEQAELAASTAADDAAALVAPAAADAIRDEVGDLTNRAEAASAEVEEILVAAQQGTEVLLGYEEDLSGVMHAQLGGNGVPLFVEKTATAPTFYRSYAFAGGVDLGGGTEVTIQGYEADLAGGNAFVLGGDGKLIPPDDGSGNYPITGPISSPYGAKFQSAVQAPSLILNGYEETVLAGFEADLSGHGYAVIGVDGKLLTGETASVGPVASPFAGMKWASLGDSITGQGRWQAQLSAYLGLGAHTNCGQGGSRVAKPDAAIDNKSMCDDTRIDAIPSDSEMILFMGLTNDFGQSYPLGAITPVGTTSFDNTTVYGALEEVAAKLLARFNTGQLIAWMTPVFGKWQMRVTSSTWATPYYNTLGLGMADYAEPKRKVAQKYGFPVIDLPARLGWNSQNAALFFDDESGSFIHPSAAIGGPRMAAVIGDELNRLGRTAALIAA